MPEPGPTCSEYRRAYLTVAAMERLADARRRRDTAAEQGAVVEVVELHLDVARSIAGRYRRRGIAEDDLVQVASLALVRAVHHYQPGRGTDFLAYAVPVIRGDLRHHFRDHGWVVRPPRRVQELQGRLIRERDHTPADQGERESSRLADRLGTTAADVEEALAAEGCFTPLSLDRQVGDASSTSMGDTLPQQGVDGSAEAREMLRLPVRGLGPRDRQVVGMRFFEQLTQQEIAESLGVTQTQVSKMIARILRDLRAQVGELGEQAPRREGPDGSGELQHLA